MSSKAFGDEFFFRQNKVAYPTGVTSLSPKGGKLPTPSPSTKGLDDVQMGKNTGRSSTTHFYLFNGNNSK